MRWLEAGQPYDEAELDCRLTPAVADVVRKLAEIGIDVPSDGEFGKRGAANPRHEHEWEVWQQATLPDGGFSQNWNLVRVHPEVQWAKLEVLVEGARLASQELWGRAA